MGKEKGQFHSTGLFALLLLAVFALCLLLVLLTGARVYAGLTEEGTRHHSQRTAANYLATRLSQGDGVYTEDFGGVTALVFPEEQEGRVYLTRVYCYEGWLRELYTAESGTFSPSDGERLLEMEQLTARIDGGSITVEFTLPGEAPRQLLWQTREGGL